MASEYRKKGAASPASEVVRQFVIDKAAEKINAKIAKQADKVAAKTAMHVETLERLAAHLETIDVWTRTDRISRKPRFSRDDIAATAIRIADAEGFEAVSMRRLAAEMGAGTMTLYHYVRTKDELLALVVDAMMGELLYPPDEPIPADWREALTGIATRTRAALERHPWTLDINDDGLLGPNSVRHFDQTMQAVAPLHIPLGEKFDIISAVDEYVFGYCLHHRNNQMSREQTFDDDTLAYVNGLVESGDYPQLEAMTREYGLEEGWRLIDTHMRDPQRFARNLARLLDGFESEIQRR